MYRLRNELFGFSYNQLLPIYGALNSLVIANAIADYKEGKEIAAQIVPLAQSCILDFERAWAEANPEEPKIA